MVSDNLDGASKGLDTIARYGYTFLEWYFVGYNTKGKRYQKLSYNTFTKLSNLTIYTNGSVTDVHAYPKFQANKTAVQFYDVRYANIGSSTEYGFNDEIVIPEHSDTTKSYQWVVYKANSTTECASVPFTQGMTMGDALNQLFGFRNSNAAYDPAGPGYKMVDIAIREVEVKENISFSVTFNNGGGTGAAQTFTYNDKGAFATNNGLAAGTKPEASFSKTGHTFKGWATTNNATAAIIGSAGALSTAITNITNGGAYTLYAVWEPNAITVTFNQNKPSGVTANVGSWPSNPTGLKYGDSYTIPTTTPSLSGYTFDGYATSATGAVAYQPGATINNITSAVTLFAKWTAWPKVTYNGNGSNGGTVPTAVPVAPNTTHTISNGVPTKTGFTFGGWSTSSNGTGTKYSYNGGIAGTTGTMNVGTSDITLYAVWNPAITFNANKPSGALSSTNVSGMPSAGSATAGTAYTLPTNTPTLQGYTFAGWKANNTGNTIAAGASAGILSAATEFYAQWTEKSGYSVTFYANATGASDGAAHNTQSNLNWTSNVTLPTAPSKTGYTFGGWFLAKDNNGSGTGTQMTAATSFAQLWSMAGASASTTSLKLYAKWTEKDRVTFTLNPNGGTYSGSTSGYTESNILNGGSFTIPATSDKSNPTRTGYNFKGWAENTNGTGTIYQAGASFTNLTSSKVLYAVWEGATITFSFQPGATSGVTNVKGTSPYTMTAKYNANLAVPAGTTVYTRTGYSFGNWGYTNNNGTTSTVVAAGASVPVSNFKISWTGDSAAGTLVGTATLTANWTAFSYTIAWNTQGGNTINNTTGLNANSTIALPTAPTRSGYTFKGWNTVAAGTGKAVAAGATLGSTWDLTTSALASGGTVTAYAQWEENKVQIRFFQGDNTSGIQYGDGSSYTNGSVIYVGAATGAIYASASATTPTNKNISVGAKPLINAGYEFNATNGSKWTIGSATGTAVASSQYGAGGLLTVPKTGGLYTNADYYVTVSPQGLTFTVEYYTQNVNGTGYTKVSTPAGSGSAPFGYAVEPGTTAGTNNSTKTVTFTRQDITGFTYNPSATGSVNRIVMATSGNVLKLYFDRNTYTVNVSYSGAVPEGMSYSPATQNKKFGETVTLTRPTAPTGYTWGGWKLVSGPNTAVGSGNFTMPAGSLVIEGTWSKIQYRVDFLTDTTYGAALQGTSSYRLDFGDQLPDLPTANPKDSNSYYFMGWRLYENCSTAGSPNSGTKKGILSPDAILGLGADAGTPWTVSSNTVFVAEFGRIITIVYTSGAASGAFATKNGAQSGNTITQYGTRYSGLQQGWTLPVYGGTVDATGDRNGGNPTAAPGYKFVGWEWTDAIKNQTFRTEGYYTGTDATRVFHKTAGADLPTVIDQSLTFTAIWEETTQHLHFDNNVVNISGLTGTGATDTSAKTGQSVTLPTATQYKSTKNPSGYTLVGWTTVSSGYVQGTSPLYTTTFTMTAGDRNTTLYTLGDYGYGVTLYPVFRENTVTINYTYATGSSASMGNLSASNEGNSFAMVSGTPKGSTATAGTGHKFIGWFTDAAGTNAVPASWISGGKITPQKNADGVYAAATYYAKFEAEEYTIIFMLGDASNAAHGQFSDNTTANKTTTIVYNTQYGNKVPGTTADKGYGFVSWKNVATGTTYTAASLQALRATADATYVAVWEPRSGYTVAYETNGGSPTLASQKVTWTAVLNDVMTNDAKTGMYKQGYTFDGWYVKSDFSASSKVNSTMTFEQGLGLAGITGDGDTATLTLYAKWLAREITVHFVPNDPTNSTTIADKKVTWTDKNLLGANATLSAPGYNFTKWSTTNSASGMTVTNDTLVSAIYQALYGNTDNTKTEITLYGIWGQKSFTVEFQDASGKVLKTQSGLTWADSIDYFAYAPTDGSQRLLGWKYTPAGGSVQTWLQSAGKLAVSAFDGTPTPADGSTFVLVADLEDNVKYIINFNKVNVDGSGNVNMGSVNKVHSINGFATPGVAIDITNFNTHDYITEFENQNGAGRRTDLKGYELKVIPATKTTSTAAEATAGATIEFNVYWVEKVFTITYDLGKDAFGNAAPSTVTKPADKNASWNSTDILPDTTPTWEGHKAPKWQYRNAAGQLVTVPSGFKVSDLIGTAADDNTKPITLYALWDSDTVRLTYQVQTGGSANNAAGSFLVNGGASRTQDIDAVNGTPYTMTATAGSGYKFVGWYKDGVLLTNDATMTPAKDGDLFSSATYEARFAPLGAIQYTVQHWFQGLDGTYAQDSALDDTRSGEEFSRVTVSNDMIKNIKGFTYKAGLTGSIEVIESLTGGQILKLMYERNAYDVWVTPAGTGADAPTPTPTPTYPSTGITQAHTTQKYGESLVLPTITAPTGWEFKWTVTSSDTAFGTQTMGNGDAVTMPAGTLTITGTWVRLGHNVYFVAGNGAHGTVTTTGGATLPFTVDHGKNLKDQSATGSSANIVVKADNEWAFNGWSYVDPDTGETKTTRDPDSILITADVTFTALWAQTFAVTYYPGLHGGNGFTAAIVAGDDIENNTKNVNEFPLMIGGVNVTSNAPAATGYEFIGWTWNKDGQTYYWTAPGKTYNGAGVAGTMDFMITGNVDFTALWAAAEQKLIYKLDLTVTPAPSWTAGGKPGMAGTTGDEYEVGVRTDDITTLLTSGDVARPGYTLKGWAVWTDNGDGKIDVIELGQTMAAGGTFKMPAGTVYLVPVWDFESAQIRYEIQIGSEGKGTISNTVDRITDSSMSYRDLIGSIASPKPGYAFDGWYTADGTKVSSSWYPPAFDDDFNVIGYQLKPRPDAAGWLSVTYYAKFVATNTGFKVEYYFQNPDGSYSKRDDLTVGCDHLETGDTASVLDPNNHAYQYLLDMSKFPGYKYDEGAYGSILSTVVDANGNSVLKLYHSNVPFNIDYVLGTNDEGVAGTWSGTPGKPSAIAGSNVTIPGIKLDGMKHAGWEISYVDPTTGETKTTFIGVNDSFNMPLADVIATAVWAKVVDVTVEFIKDNGEKVVFKTELVQNAGTVGDAWNGDASWISKYRPAGYKWVSGALHLDSLAAGDNLVQIVYGIVKDYKVIFNANTGTKTETVGGFTIDSIVADKQTHPTKPGYTLAGWSTKANGKVELTATMTYEQLAKLIHGKFDTTNDETILKNGLTVYAVWTENGNYKVIYDLNNDKTTNSTIKKPVPSTANPLTPDPIENVKWTQAGFNKYSDAELDAAPAGYEFVGWNTRRDGKGLTITDATKYLEMSNAINKNTPQASVTLYAMWKEIQIEIKYVTTDGGTIDRVLDRVSAVTGQHVGTGSSAGNRLHSVATAKPGYHFVRWELVNTSTGRTIGLDENGWHTIRNDKNEIVVEDPGEEGRLFAATYRAVFEKNADAVINYDVNGGEGEIPSTKQTFGLNVNLHNGTGVKRGHYTLVGWNTEADGSGTTYKLGQGMVMPEGGMNLYAMWEVNSYGVNVKDRDDHVATVDGGSTKVEWGEPLSPEFIESIKQTPKKGSTFAGWKYTMTDADTGEVIEGVVWDLSELTVLGPIEIEALYDTVPAEDVVTEGTTLPKTGDDGLLGIVAMVLIALVALVLFIVLLARRRSDDEDGDDAPRGSRAPRARVRAAARAARLAARNKITSGMRNGISNASLHEAGVTYACADAAAARLQSPATPYTTSHTRGSFFVSRALFVAALALVVAIGFAPGHAIASTGDPGTGSAANQTNISTQSHHSNADPATTQTGSFQSKSASVASKSSQAASASASSTSNSSARAASSSAAASPRSASGSAASQVKAVSASSSTSKACSGTTSAQRDAIIYMTARNKLAHNASSSATRASSANARYSAAAAASASSTSATRIVATKSATSANSASVATFASTAASASAANSASAKLATSSISTASGNALVGDSAACSTFVLAGSGSAVAASGSASVLGNGSALAALAADPASSCSAALVAPLAASAAYGGASALAPPATAAEASLASAASSTSANSTASADLARESEKNASTLRLYVTNVLTSGDSQHDSDALEDPYSENPRWRSDMQENCALQTQSSSSFSSIKCNDEELTYISYADSGMLAESAFDEATVASGEAVVFSDEATDLPRLSAMSAEPQVDDENASAGTDEGDTGEGTDTPEVTEPTDPVDPVDPTDPVDPVEPGESSGEIVAPVDPVDPVDPVEPVDPVDPTDPVDPADPVDPVEPSDPVEPTIPADPTTPTEPTTPQPKPNTYVLTYDMNGGTVAGSSSSTILAPSTCTVGKDEILTCNSKLKKEGHTFVCWNTDASGMGVPIRDGEAFTADKLRAMLLETTTAPTDGASIKLYAQWNTTDASPVLLDPSVPDEPTAPTAPVAPLPSVNRPTNSTATNATATNTASRPSAAATAPRMRTVASPAFDGQAEADPLAGETIAEGDNALASPLPPVLEVLPAAAEEFTTRSAEALAGLSEGGEGILGAVANMTPAQVTQAVAAVAAAAGAVALVAGAAGASTSAVARRRIERTIATDAEAGAGDR